MTALEYSNRKEVRDAAVTKLQEAITLANANEFTTPGAWANGNSYTNVQIAQIANTMAAMTLAYYPRDNTEVAAVDGRRSPRSRRRGCPSALRSTFGTWAMAAGRGITRCSRGSTRSTVVDFTRASRTCSIRLPRRIRGRRTKEEIRSRTPPTSASVMVHSATQTRRIHSGRR